MELDKRIAEAIAQLCDVAEEAQDIVLNKDMKGMTIEHVTSIVLIDLITYPVFSNIEIMISLTVGTYLMMADHSLFKRLENIYKNNTKVKDIVSKMKDMKDFPMDANSPLGIKFDLKTDM